MENEPLTDEDCFKVVATVAVVAWLLSVIMQGRQVLA
jgi:hypothetical protein